MPWSLQTVDANNPASRFLKQEALTFEGPWDAIFVNPPAHLELDVGSGAPVRALLQHLTGTSSQTPRACQAGH